MTNALFGIAAAVVGVGAGWLTHRLNQWFATTEPEATEPALPREELWAPLLDAVLLGILFYRAELNARSVVASVVIVILVQVLVFDARHRLILNRVIYPASALAVLGSTVNPLISGTLRERVVSALLGAVAAGLFFLLLSLATRGGIGLGDAKLAFFLGATLGATPLPSPIVRALIAGIVFGGVVSVALLVSGVKGMKDYIAYGPYLCLGGAYTLLFPP